MDSLGELLPFIQPHQRIDVKAAALSHVFSLTGSMEGTAAILNNEDVLLALLRLSLDDNLAIATDAVNSLINLSAEAKGAVTIYETAKKADPIFRLFNNGVNKMLDDQLKLADAWCCFLSNITRVGKLVDDTLEDMKNENFLVLLILAFQSADDQITLNRLDYIGPLFCNLTQSARARAVFFDKVFTSILIRPARSYSSVILRGGIIGMFKNMCSDSTYHDDLLHKSGENIISCLLYPLIGPEDYIVEENDKFPLDLQYLGPSKTREEDPDLRKTALEALLQLCATKKWRVFLREKGVYEILRDYHKWEMNVSKDKDCLLACENVVDILIKTEEEIGVDNYKDVEVPAHLSEKFFKEDASYLETITK